MTATVHRLPVEPSATVSRVQYDSEAGRWLLTVDEQNTLPAPATSVPAHVLDALASFLDAA